MNNPRAILLLGAALLIIGSLLPWASLSTIFGEMEINGTDDGRDGIFTLGMGVLIGLGALIAKPKPQKRASWGAIVLGAIAGLIAIYDIADINSIADEPFAEIEVGIGLYVVAVGAVISLVGGLLKWPGEEPQFPVDSPAQTPYS